VLIYSIAAQVFMPYLIIYMETYLGFTVVEYSIVFGVAILFGAAINVLLGILSDKVSKVNLMFIAAAVYSIGLFVMYFMNFASKTLTLIGFGVAGFVMITGYIFVISLTGSLMRDHTPENKAGKLQGVRMVFSVLIPMIVGPMIGNAINKAMNIPLPNAGANAITTEYIPAPEIFLAGSLIVLLMFVFIPLLKREVEKK
ncbi:MAG: MFS transporter, partial [Clostridia bacterium]|nr:MFS transporter [Clostridia bacterium]